MTDLSTSPPGITDLHPEVDTTPKVDEAAMDRYVSLLQRCDGKEPLTDEETQELGKLALTRTPEKPTCLRCGTPVTLPDPQTQVDSDSRIVNDYLGRRQREKQTKAEYAAAQKELEEAEAAIEKCALKGGDSKFLEDKRDALLFKVSATGNSHANAKGGLRMGERCLPIIESVERLLSSRERDNGERGGSEDCSG